MDLMRILLSLDRTPAQKLDTDLDLRLIANALIEHSHPQGSFACRLLRSVGPDAGARKNIYGGQQQRHSLLFATTIRCAWVSF
jgi:hypothetical protein